MVCFFHVKTVYQTQLFTFWWSLKNWCISPLSASHLTLFLAKGQCYSYSLCFLFWVRSVTRECWVGVRVKKDGCGLGRATQTVPQNLALNLWAVHNNAGFVINSSQKTPINHNIHEAPATEWEWPWLLSQCAYASPGVKEYQRGHSPGDLGQRHHPHPSQTSGLKQHLERLNHTLGKISDF